MNVFRENVTVDFFMWPLACVLSADPATAVVLGNGTLKSLKSTTPPHTAFPFMMNDPKNQIESNWVPLLDALPASEGETGQETGTSWLETTMKPPLGVQPNIVTLEDNLATISSLAFSLLIQRWRIRYANNDTALASTWIPQTATVPGEVPVLKAHLQVSRISLLVGSLSVLVLCATSAMCIVAHGTTDDTVRDGGVIDLVSMLHNSALPEILAGHHKDDKNQEIDEVVFATRRTRARRVIVASVYSTHSMGIIF